MKLRTTLILLLLTGALLAFVLIHERQQPGTREQKVLEVRPFSFKSTDVDEIEISRKDATLRLLLRGEAWRIGQPFEDAADPDLVKQMLEAIPAIEWVETMAREDLRKEDLKRTGLGDDEFRLTVRSKGALLAQLALGAPAVLDGCAYASLPARKNQIHVARTKLPALVAKSDDEWRDTRLTRLKSEDILHFTISAGSGGMEFIRAAGQPWQLVKPIQTRGSDERVTAVMNALINLKVKPTKLATPTTAAGPDLPVMKVTLEGERLPKPVVLTLHPSADPSAEVQVQSDQRDGYFLAGGKVSDFWKLQPNHLRDQNLVSIRADEVNALKIRSLTQAEVVLDKTGGAWTLKRFGKEEQANQERITKLFEALNSTQVREFISDTGTNLEPWGLANPFLSIVWQTPVQTKTLQFGQGKEGILTARVADEPFIYRIGAGLLNSIPPDSLRWRGTQITRASIFTARRIIVAEGDKPSVTLFHNPDDTSWTASIAGRDVTAQLDKARANRLLQKLVDFQASDWSSDRSGAILALKNPSLTVQLLLTEPGGSRVEAKPVTLSFAPLQPGMDTALYHGRKDQDPDTFLITRDLYHDLIAPVLK